MVFLFVLVMVVLAAEVFVRILSRKLQQPQSFDYILLLGSNGRIKNPITQDRAYNAAEALKKWPTAKLILTGNEERGEVTAFKILLKEHGVTEFVEETQSRNTWDNMRRSLPLFDNSKAVLIVTSEYHQPRALAMARSLGLKSSSFGKDRVRYERRVYFILKERISNVRYLPHLIWNSMNCE